MKGRPQPVRRPADQSGRGRAGAHFFRAAFSLLELLIVVAILLVLTTLYWGSTSQGDDKKLRQSCAGNLEKIYVALDIYANEHGGSFPEVTNARTAAEALNPLVPRYTADTASFICPASKATPPPDESLLQGKISYAYYMGRSKAGASGALMSDAQVDTLAKAPGQLAFSPDGKPPGNNHGRAGGNFLFADGHTEFSPARVPYSLGLTGGVVLLNP